MIRRASIWVGLLLALPLATGCGSKPAAALPEAGKAELQDIWQMYSAYTARKGNPPTKADDMKVQSRESPFGGGVLHNSNFVVLYGTPVGGSNVLAYQKDVPAQGGLVLLSDGTIRPMSAAEFQAAPKAGK